MQNKCNTLLDKLVSLVSVDHIEEVTLIVDKLTRINNLKYTIDNNAPVETLYKKIAYELQVEFQIFNFDIILVTNNIESTIYTFGEGTLVKHTFHYYINESTHFDIKIYKETIDEFDRLSLNSYFEDIMQIVYLHYTLTNTQTIMIDPLTELTSRISFQKEIKTLIPLAMRENMNIGVLLINIDRFRAVNDEHGNEFGDQFLKLYADVIKKSIRNSDIAVRFAGGEFLVLLVNVESNLKTMEIAESLKERLSQAYLKSPNGDHFKKTVCIGVSMFPEDSDNINDIIKNTEIALSDARDSGRNIVLKFRSQQENVIELF